MNAPSSKSKNISNVCACFQRFLQTMDSKDIDAYFVRFRNQDPEEYRTKLMSKAFGLLRAKGFGCEWVDEISLLGKQFQAQVLFVFSKFDGLAFSYLKGNKNRIVSPFVILYCDAKFAKTPFPGIPTLDAPIYSQCMRGLTVTASGFSHHMKRKISNMVSSMSGHYTQVLTVANNFLVTDSVLSDKYRVAKEMASIQIVKLDWVFHCDEKYQMLFKRADDSNIVEKYKVPILHNLVICVSGIEQRDEIEKMVVENGGKYSRALDLEKPNTYLLINKPIGDKYKHARLKNIPCLRAQWLYDSIEHNIALSLKEYELTECPREDAPILRSRIKHPTIKLDNVARKLPTLATDISLIEQNTAKAISRNVGKLLDDCAVHLIGFDKTTAGVLEKSAEQFGAMIMNKFESIVTHVIAGPNVSEEESQKFAGLSFNNFVTIKWYLACLEKGELVSENAYKYDIHKRQPKTDIPLNTSLKTNSKTFTAYLKRAKKVNTVEELKKITDFSAIAKGPPPLVMNVEKNFLSMRPRSPTEHKLKFVSPRKKTEAQLRRVLEPESGGWSSSSEFGARD